MKTALINIYYSILFVFNSTQNLKNANQEYQKGLTGGIINDNGLEPEQLVQSETLMPHKYME